MDLVIIHTAFFIFYFHHNLLPKAFDNFFSLTSVWNNLDENLKSSSLNLFKQMMKTDILIINLLWMLDSIE